MPRTAKHPFNVSMEPIARKIMKSEERRGKSPKEAKRIAFGRLNNMGAKKGNVTTKKGAAMMAEHKVRARGKLKKYERKVSRQYGRRRRIRRGRRR